MDLEDYGAENYRNCRYVLVVIDIFSKLGWTIPLKKRTARTIPNSFENLLISSKRKPNLIQNDRCKSFYINIFQNFLNKNNTENYSRNTYLGAVFAESFNRTIRGLLKRPVFEKNEGNWIVFLSTKTKQYNNRVHSSTKLTPVQSNL